MRYVLRCLLAAAFCLLISTSLLPAQEVQGNNRVGLWVGGAGFAAFEASVSAFGVDVSETETGAGFVVGLGYDISINKSGSLALTPYFNWVVTTVDPTIDFLQFGLGLTFN